MNVDHFTYRVTWSPEDGEHVGLCVEFPSLSWLACTPEEALSGVRRMVAEVVADLEMAGETVPGNWGQIPIKSQIPVSYIKRVT